MKSITQNEYNKHKDRPMTEYYYPNEVKIVVENGKRVAYLKDNWREIREKNERKTSPAVLRDTKVPWSFWEPPNYYWGA